MALEGERIGRFSTGSQAYDKARGIHEEVRDYLNNAGKPIHTRQGTRRGGEDNLYDIWEFTAIHHLKGGITSKMSTCLIRCSDFPSENSGDVSVELISDGVDLDKVKRDLEEIANRYVEPKITQPEAQNPD